MKKHFASILVAVVSLVCFNLTAKADDDVTWIDVSTAEEFDAAVRSSVVSIDGTPCYNANIRLTTDIDLSSLTGTDYLYSYPFAGRITGACTKGDRLNFALSGQKMTLFNNLKGCTIEHLVIQNGTFQARDASSGLLADESQNATINDVLFSGTHVSASSDGIDYDRMGVATGIAKGCKFQYLMFIDCKLCIDGQELAMVAAEATDCEFTGCIVNLHCELWADGNSILGAAHNAYVGGICGYAAGCAFNKCYNFGVVSSDDDETGGIVGYAKKSDKNATTITDCQNGGLVYHCTKDGFGRTTRQSVANEILKSAIIAGVTDLVPLVFFTSYSGDLDYFLDSYDNDFMDEVEEYYLNACNWNTQHSLHYEEMLYNIRQSNPTLGTTILFSCVANSPIAMLATTAALSLAYESLAIYNLSFVTAPDQIGGIAGYVTGGTQVVRCANAGPINGADKYVGGIVGDLADSSIKDCYNRSFVNSGLDTYTGNYVGGIVGYCKNGTITGNLNVGPVTADTKKFGSTQVGNIEGYITGDYTGSNNYYLNETDVANGTASVGFSQEKLPSGAVALALNNALTANGESPIWRQALGVGKDFYPVIGNDETKPIVTATTESYSLVQNVSNGGEFYLAIANPKAQISLQNDIDLDNFYFNCSSQTYPFRGTIEGNGYTISNASYTFSSGAYDVDKGTKAFFPYATGATFRNFTLDDFHVYQKNENVYGEIFSTFALLVAVSENCTYDNIRVRNSNLLLNDGLKGSSNKRQNVGGLIAISNNDKLTDCTMEGTCQFEGLTGKSIQDANVAGFAARAYGTTFTRCNNAAGIDSDDDNDGGIVAYAENCIIANCLNTGPITGQKYVGGIAGRAKGTTITQCVNTGTIYDDENTKESNRAGIVGLMETSGSISDCLNFGEVEYPGDDSGSIDGAHKDAVTYGDGNYYYCQYDGKHFSNMSDEMYANVASGEYAYSKDWLYQSIDNDPFCTKLPVPIPAAGTVYRNYLCDGNNTLSYSNHYQGAANHTTSSFAGICSLCGNRKSAAPEKTTINSVSELQAFAQAVNSGMDFTGKTVNLESDLDMDGVTDFAPIGIDRTHAFKGTFLGHGHRIKNLTIQRTNDAQGTGVFGCVSGRTFIEDLIVDASCSISSVERGTAGLVGCLISPDGSTDPVSLTLRRCGNEAPISGSTNVAGLVGGVYYNNAFSNLYVYDCYNTGNVSGKKESAALIGWGGDNLDVKRCYNVGSASGTATDHSAIRYNTASDAVKFADFYQLNNLANDANATTKTLDNFADGVVCNLLNAYYSPENVWGQNLGTDYNPQLSTAGIRHERSMSSTWGTVVLPYALSSNDAVQLYQVVTCDASEEATSGSLTLKPVDEVTANTPCFFKKLDDSATSVCFSMGSGAFTYTDDDPESIVEPILSDAGWSMVGSYDALSGLTGIYYLAQDKLWYAEEAITLPAYRAYMTHVDMRRPCKSLSLLVLDDDDQVDEIVNINADGEDGPCYNLAGQRVTGSAKGIVIKKGIKYLRK